MPNAKKMPATPEELIIKWRKEFRDNPLGCMDEKAVLTGIHIKELTASLSAWNETLSETGVAMGRDYVLDDDDSKHLPTHAEVLAEATKRFKEGA
mgnify:CR=1 FL=1